MAIEDEYLSASHEAIERQVRQGIEELDRGEGIPEHELDSYIERLKVQED